MSDYPEAAQIRKIVDEAHKIVIVQADNPDADSLGSALALENLLGEMGKEPYLYGATDMPTYLRYLSGWDRVQKDLPAKFDASIIVDASTMTLFEKLADSGQQGWLAARPCVVLDHHEIVENSVPFATVIINDHTRASTGELIWLLAQQLQWPVPPAAQVYLMSSILGDTQGLTNQLASADTYRIMADFIDHGVDRPQLEELRREFGKMQPAIYRYKAQLISRTEFSDDGKLASVTVPQTEINEYSPLYNPAPLIQGDMLQTAGVQVAIVFKHYDDGKITGAIRANPGASIAAELAEHMGGGGHAFASGFKVVGSRPFDEVKTDCLAFAQQLLDKLESKS
ncbi:MAG TPA: DHH family phosphoesterase [Candidatus Saccharimonadia bacterium]|nr:DHH family phosphoesterase [Candidatus Saccharimonadia bacterium]